LETSRQIRSEDDAIAVLEELAASPAMREIYSITFDGWPNLHVKIIGSEYNSSLKSSQLRALIKLQETIYYQYGLLTGRDEAKLTSDERKALELNIKIGNGSSDLIVELIQIFTHILSSGLLSTDFVTGVVLLTAIYGSINIANRHFDCKDKELTLEERKLNVITDLLQRGGRLQKLAESAHNALDNISRSAPDSDDILINNASTRSYSSRKIARKKKEPPPESIGSFALGKHYSLVCAVVGLKDEDNGRYECRFKDSTSGEILIWRERRSNIAGALDHKLRMAFNSKNFDVNTRFEVIKVLRSGAEINVFEIFGQKPRSFGSQK